MNLLFMEPSSAHGNVSVPLFRRRTAASCAAGFHEIPVSFQLLLISGVDIDRLFRAVCTQGLGKLCHTAMGIFLIDPIIPRNHLSVQIACRKDPDNRFVLTHIVSDPFCSSFCP
jgi:hypothetical protein